MEHEINFWREFVKTDRFLKGWCSNEKTPELNDIVYNFLKERPEANVLDVGSGVVSLLHGTVPSDKLTAYDPLAIEYRAIFDYKGIKKPLAVMAESMVDRGRYDIVHISNAIDHTQDPLKAYDNLFRAVKPGGFLIVQGFVNEGTHENWSGFHQWDIDIDNRNYLTLEKDGLVSVIAKKPYFATKIHIEMLGREWLIWIAQKPTA